jgi:hypothetical protein
VISSWHRSGRPVGYPDGPGTPAALQLRQYQIEEIPNRPGDLIGEIMNPAPSTGRICIQVPGDFRGRARHLRQADSLAVISAMCLDARSSPVIKNSFWQASGG